VAVYVVLMSMWVIHNLGLSRWIQMVLTSGRMLKAKPFVKHFKNFLSALSAKSLKLNNVTQKLYLKHRLRNMLYSPTCSSWRTPSVCNYRYAEYFSSFRRILTNWTVWLFTQSTWTVCLVQSHGLLQFSVVLHHRQLIPVNAVSAGCCHKSDYADWSTRTHLTCSVRTTLAACSLPCGLQAGNTYVQHTAWLRVVILVRCFPVGAWRQLSSLLIWYHQHHSTETAVLKVYNDLLMVAESGLVSAMCLLDLTAVFDTVDHDLLLCLERHFGLQGVTLLWFRSYLSGRSYCIWFAGATSRTVHVICSVPQGSVLGPRLFIMYSADLADKAVEHNVNFYSYANDTQLYVHCRPEEIAATILLNWNAASQTWTIGCLRTGSS